MNITNSFHSTAFSLIFEKPLVVVNRSEKINTRMRDLLGLMDMSNYLVSSFEEFNRLDYSVFKVNQELKNQHIKRSKEFLLSAIGRP